jgi:MFS family permease
VFALFLSAWENAMISRMKNLFSHSIKSTLFALYVIGFIFAFSSALPAYASSSFLGTLTGEALVSIVYIICAAATLAVFLVTPKILKKYGNYKTTVVFSVVNTLALLGLAFFHNVFTVIFCFIVTYVASTIIGLCLDIFIEHNSFVSDTGEVRSIYLTSTNVAWLISPWLAGLLIGQSAYWKVFFAAGLVMIPTLFIIVYNLRKFADPIYDEIKISTASRDVWRNKDIKGIFALNFLLQFFFAVMVIYTPIYLNKYIGFDWTTIGIMFTIMLIPFVILQVPAGELADKRYGEKEMLSLSFIIMAISTALIPMIGGKTFLIWTILLFTTRVGASIAQVMCDTYLFKKVTDKDAGIINLYRTMSPLANIFGPIVAIVCLYYFSFSGLFFLLGFLMLFGLRYSVALTDTK